MKIVLFDIDETLLHAPAQANGKASGVMFKEVFNKDTTEDSIENKGMTEQGIIYAVLAKVGTQGGSIKQEIIPPFIPDTAYKIWADASAKEMIENPARLLPGAKELLEVLSAQNDVKVCLLTGNSRMRAEAKLKSAGIDNFFKDGDGSLRGVFGEMAPKRADLFTLAKEKLGAQGDTFIVIDDSELGAQMAKEAGIPFIGVETGIATRETLSNYTQHIFKDFGEQRYQQVVKVIGQLQ